MLGIGISSEKAQVAVGAAAGIVWGSIQEAFFNDLKEDLSKDKEIKNFVDDNEKYFKEWYTFYSRKKKGFGLAMAIDHCQVDIKWDSVGQKCIAKMNAIVGDNPKYNGITNNIINHYVTAGVIYDD